MKEFKLSQLLRLGLFVYFLIPYFIFLTYYNFPFDVDFGELFWALRNALMQSGLAALAAVILSIPMSQGLLLLPEKTQRVAERLLMVPQILPALYSILIAFSVVNPFPMGGPGIVILFVLINLGFTTLLTYSATRERLGMLSVVSEVYSLGRSRFFLKIYFPLLRRDLIINFFMVFIFCLSSFSIPLIVGGGKGTNLEVLIYEKIFIEQNWSAAFGLCLFQAALIFGLSFFVLKSKYYNPPVEFSSGNYLKSYPGFFLIVIYLMIYLGGYAVELMKSFGAVDFILQYGPELWAATLFTTKALIFYLILNFSLLILWLMDYLKNQRFSLAINLISVSTVLIGFAIYLAFPLTREYDSIKIIFAMSILFFPSLFKLFLQRSIENLQQQILISQVYGLSWATIIVDVIFRQISRQLYLWLSILIIGFVSEYAVLKALGVQTQTLGLFTEGFLSGYRLSLSYLMSFYILIYWLFAMIMVYLILKVADVVYKKLVS